ncbi:MAG: hypothetical protein N4A33_06850 [Bacteriovoracaceae bacterium]|jgi:hypothetical protein|nr:hypothetical protein [Bacteriovoracaceae bacterium]
MILSGLKPNGYLSFIGFLLLSFITHSFANELGQLEAKHLKKISYDLEDHAKRSEDIKVKNYLFNLSKEFYEKAQNMGEQKIESTTQTQKLLFKLGKGLTGTSVFLAKPFLGTVGFFKGVFQKEDKNKDAYHVMKFILNNDSRLKLLYKNSGTFKNYLMKFEQEVSQIFIDKTVLVIQDAIHSLFQLDIERDIVLKTIGLSAPKGTLTINEVLGDKIYNIDQSELKASLINEHPQFQDIKPIVGKIYDEDIIDLIVKPTLEIDVDYESVFERSVIKLHEGIIAFGGQLFLPKLALSIISKSLGSFTFAVTIISDLAASISATVCLKSKKVAYMMENKNEDYVNFCSYVVNRSAYQLSKSRAKGYVKGKNLRFKIKKMFKPKKKKSKEQTESLDAMTIE